MPPRSLAVGIGFTATLSSGVAVWLVVQLGLASTIGSLDHSPGYFEDFRIYYEQARLLSVGAAAVVEGWVYPPATALLFLPFAALSRDAAYGAWAVVQAAITACLVLRCAHYLPSYPRWQRYAFAAGLVLSSLPVVHCAKWGQLSVAVALLAMLGLQTRGWRGAALMSLAISLKLYPLCAVPFYALQKRWRDLAWVLCFACIVSGIVPVLALGCERTALLWTACWANAWKLGQESSLSSQALSVAIDKWFAPRGMVAGSPGPVLVALPQLARQSITLLLALASIATTAALSVRRDAALAAAAWLVCLAILLRPGWVHYFVVLPLAQALLLHYASSTWSLACCAISWALCAISAIASLAFSPFFFVAEYFSVVTLAALYCLLGL
ncbi:MAG TPA: glycosyltransferase family 87 protein, partial [Polyangiales bacterium]|nr:glycosyltransferase family 87 protein [Polyangiales bacterium]